MTSPTRESLPIMLSSNPDNQREVSSLGACPVILADTRSSTFTRTASAWRIVAFPSRMLRRFPSPATNWIVLRPVGFSCDAGHDSPSFAVVLGPSLLRCLLRSHFQVQGIQQLRDVVGPHVMLAPQVVADPVLKDPGYLLQSRLRDPLLLHFISDDDSEIHTAIIPNLI